MFLTKQIWEHTLSLYFLHFIYFFCYRSVPSLEPFLQVFGWGVWWNGAHYWIQQGASDQSKQRAQTAGPAGNWRSSVANTINRKKDARRKVTKGFTEDENYENIYIKSRFLNCSRTFQYITFDFCIYFGHLHH